MSPIKGFGGSLNLLASPVAAKLVSGAKIHGSFSADAVASIREFAPGKGANVGSQIVNGSVAGTTLKAIGGFTSSMRTSIGLRVLRPSATWILSPSIGLTPMTRVVASDCSNALRQLCPAPISRSHQAEQPKHSSCSLTPLEMLLFSLE